MRGENNNNRPGKRPMRSLTTQEKIDAIDRVKAGESKASVARDIGVPESTLRGWCKAEAKIRALLARSNGSATPPSSSEALSPASSLGDCMAGPSNLSSEDEGVGPGPSKRLRLGDGGDASVGVGLHATRQSSSSPALQSAAAAGVDYMSSLINSLMSTGAAAGTAGSRSDSSYLLQQLGMLSSAQASQALTKQLIGSLAAGSPQQQQQPQPQSVGLVENGLQYKLSSSKSRASSGSLASHHVSAQAPAPLDVAGKSGSRKSLPPAAEAPSTPLPVTPRRSADTSLSNGTSSSSSNPTNSNSHSHSHGTSSSSSSSTSSSSRKHSEALYMWFMQQQLNQGHGYNGAMDGSWFWQWYKQNSVPPVQSAAASLPLSSPSHVGQLSQLSHQTRSSPTKVRAVLDNVLCNNNGNSSGHSNSNNNNNNNDNGRTSLNNSSSAARYTGEPDENLLDMSTSGNGSAHRAAIQHGEELIKYLDTYSDPSVTQVQIMQFRFLLDNLKGTNKAPASKHSRK